MSNPGKQKVRTIRTVEERQELLMRRMQEEYDRTPPFSLPVTLDLHSALSLVGNLQLALRHPQNNGAAAAVARRIIDGIIERFEQAGLAAHAEAARLGDNAAYDYD